MKILQVKSIFSAFIRQEEAQEHIPVGGTQLLHRKVVDPKASGYKR